MALSTRSGSTASSGRAPTWRPRTADAQDRGGDQQSDDRVGPVPADRDSAGPRQHREAGEPVGAGGAARRRPGRRIRSVAPDPVSGDDLVARESDHCDGGHRDEVADRLLVQQPPASWSTRSPKPEVAGHLEVGADHHTPWGVVHGGVYTAALEEVRGGAAGVTGINDTHLGAARETAQHPMLVEHIFDGQEETE